MTKGKREKGIILHHWDTDGICSCVLLKDELAKEGRNIEWTTFTPRIGNYFLNEKEMKMLEKGGYSELIIADMAIPSDQVGSLSKSIGRIRHFDHHYQRPHELENVEHVNPVAMGKTQDEYPACTIVIMEHFKRDLDLPTVLGVIGDLEGRAKDNWTWKDIQPFTMRYGLAFFDLMRLTELIDANYKSDDAEGVKEAVALVSASKNDPGKILSNGAWRQKAENVIREINRWIKAKGEQKDGLFHLALSSTNHIISTVGRRVYKIRKVPVVVVNTGLPDLDQIYIRGPDMREAIRYSRDTLHLRCGGKDDVMGALVEKGSISEVLPKVLEKVPRG